MSLVRQNYHESCEAAINKQINMELYASYVYMSLSFHYERDDVALPGMAKFFRKNSDEEREHAQKFMKYQNQRGGRILLCPINAPPQQEWGSLKDGIQTALDLEKEVNQSILDLHALSSSRGDGHLSNFLEGEFVEEQVEAIKELGDMLTRARRVGSGLGEHMFDKEILERS